MLQKKAVVPEMIDMIKELQSDSLFKDHILAGGTALALQLGHRSSTDIDLFTSNIQKPNEIINYFNKKYIGINIDVADDEYIRIFANNVKIEMIYVNEKILEEPKIQEGIKLFGLNDIAAMKLKAITGRTEARDFIDIAYLLKEISLKNMFGLYKEKYETISPLYMKRTLLTKSKIIKDNEWLVGIKMLRHDIEPNDIPGLIANEIERYNKDINIGKLKDSVI